MTKFSWRDRPTPLTDAEIEAAAEVTAKDVDKAAQVFLGKIADRNKGAIVAEPTND